LNPTFSNSVFSETIDAPNVFCRIQVSDLHLRFPFVIPAQAGIQTLVFQEYFKAAATSNFWIPACAGMTAEI